MPLPMAGPSAALPSTVSERLGSASRWLARWSAYLQERGDLRALGRVFVIIFFMRYVLMPCVGFLVNASFPLDQAQSFSVFKEPNVFWDIFARYDSGWYYTIARDGYRYTADGPSNLAFFPLYPMLMRGLGGLLGGEQHHYYLAGMLISRAAFIGAIVLLFALARRDLGDEGAQRAVLYISIFPFAFFFSRVYTESLFLLLSVAAVWAFRTRRWAIGGLAGGLAALTRVNGILLILPLAVLVAEDAWRRRAKPRELVRPLLGLAMVAGGLAVFCAYSFTVAGSAWAWADSIREWDYDPGGWPWAPVIALARQLVRRPYEFLALEPNGPYDSLNGITAGLVVLSIPFIWRRLGAAYGLLVLVNLWLPLSSGQFVGLGRYCAVLFPFFIWLASFRSSTLRDLVVITFVSLYVLCLSMFVKLHPIF